MDCWLKLFSVLILPLHRYRSNNSKGNTRCSIFSQQPQENKPFSYISTDKCFMNLNTELLSTCADKQVSRSNQSLQMCIPPVSVFHPRWSKVTSHCGVLQGVAPALIQQWKDKSDVFIKKVTVKDVFTNVTMTATFIFLHLKYLFLYFR